MQRLHATTHGDPEYPPVGLVHGMMSTSRQWQPNLEALSRHFHLVLVDLWGHGASPVPADPAAYGAGGLVAALEEVRERFGLERWALVGHSFGAAVILRYAIERAERATAVVFTNSQAAMSPASSESAAEAARRITNDRDRRTIPMHPVHARHLLAPWREVLVRDADRTDLTALRYLLGGHWQLSVRSCLEQITVPATLINGRFERRFQPAADLIRNSGITVIDVDTGHSPNVEAADEFNSLIIRILASGLPANSTPETRG
jgi:pimeloyl-ACP methyl ester carboxylesterase